MRVDGDVGIADLIYIAGVSSQASERFYDLSNYAQYSNYATFVQSLTCTTDPSSGPGNHGCTSPYMFGRVTGTIRRFSNEIRLASKPGRLHWTTGAYSEKTRNANSGIEHLPNIDFSGEPAQYTIAAYGNHAMPVAGEFYSSYDVFTTSLVT